MTELLDLLEIIVQDFDSFFSSGYYVPFPLYLLACYVYNLEALREYHNWLFNEMLGWDTVYT